MVAGRCVGHGGLEGGAGVGSRSFHISLSFFNNFWGSFFHGIGYY